MTDHCALQIYRLSPPLLIILLYNHHQPLIFLLRHISSDKTSGILFPHVSSSVCVCVCVCVCMCVCARVRAHVLSFPFLSISDCCHCVSLHIYLCSCICWRPECHSQYSDWLRAGHSGDQRLVVA